MEETLKIVISYFLNTVPLTQDTVRHSKMELARSCVQICVQDKRKSSYDCYRNCLIFKEWSHLGLNQRLPANI